MMSTIRRWLSDLLKFLYQWHTSTYHFSFSKYEGRRFECVIEPKNWSLCWSYLMYSWLCWSVGKTRLELSHESDQQTYFREDLIKRKSCLDQDSFIRSILYKEKVCFCLFIIRVDPVGAVRTKVCIASSSVQGKIED